MRDRDGALHLGRCCDEKPDGGARRACALLQRTRALLPCLQPAKGGGQLRVMRALVLTQCRHLRLKPLHLRLCAAELARAACAPFLVLALPPFGTYARFSACALGGTQRLGEFALRLVQGAELRTRRLELRAQLGEASFALGTLPSGRLHLRPSQRDLTQSDLLRLGSRRELVLELGIRVGRRLERLRLGAQRRLELLALLPLDDCLLAAQGERRRARRRPLFCRREPLLERSQRSGLLVKLGLVALGHGACLVLRLAQLRAPRLFTLGEHARLLLSRLGRASFHPLQLGLRLLQLPLGARELLLHDRVRRVARRRPPHRLVRRGRGSDAAGGRYRAGLGTGHTALLGAGGGSGQSRRGRPGCRCSGSIGHGIVEALPKDGVWVGPQREVDRVAIVDFHGVALPNEGTVHKRAVRGEIGEAPPWALWRRRRDSALGGRNMRLLDAQAHWPSAPDGEGAESPGRRCRRIQALLLVEHAVNAMRLPHTSVLKYHHDCSVRHICGSRVPLAV